MNAFKILQARTSIQLQPSAVGTIQTMLTSADQDQISYYLVIQDSVGDEDYYYITLVTNAIQLLWM